MYTEKKLDVSRAMRARCSKYKVQRVTKSLSGREEPHSSLAKDARKILKENPYDYKTQDNFLK